LKTAAWLILAACCLGLPAAGCTPPCPKTLISMDQLVDDYNANAARAPRLWARAKIDGKLAGLGSLRGINGILVLSKDSDNKLGPYDFLLRAREMEGELRVGSSVDEGLYYLWYGFGQKGSAWAGRLKLAGAPGVTGLLIDPNQLLAVLCICPLPADFTDAPTVAMTMDTRPEHCAYVLTYIDRQPVTRRLGFRREVYFNWSHKPPAGPWWKKLFAPPPTELAQPRPFMVKFFDDQGRRIMTAKLKDYKPIDTTGMENPPTVAPVMPTDIHIDWPERNSSVHIVLSEMTARTRGNPKKVPDSRIIWVDEHIAGKGARP